MNKLNLVTLRNLSSENTELHFQASLPVLPASVDLRQWMPKIEDQTTLGSCTANAWSTALEMLMVRALQYQDLSRLYLYYYERLIFGNVNQDTGAALLDGPLAIEQYGIPFEVEWPYVETNVLIQPSQSAIDAAANKKDLRAERVAYFPGTTNGDYQQSRIKTALAMGYPVAVSLKVGNQIFGLAGSITNGGSCYFNPIDPTTNALAGGHAVCIVGYTSEGWICVNSWGQYWGDGGYFLIGFNILPIDGVEAWTVTRFMGIEFQPIFTEDTTPLVITMPGARTLQYKDSNSSPYILLMPHQPNPPVGLLCQTTGGHPDYDYDWSASSTDLIYYQADQDNLGKFVLNLSSWAPGEAKQYTVTCRVKDTSLPIAQQATYVHNVTVVNSLDIEGTTGKLNRLYKGAFGRMPDDAGFWWWYTELETGQHTLYQAAQGFVASVEFNTLFPNANPTQFVTSFYRNIFKREPDAGGLAWWVGEYNAGRKTAADILIGFTESAEGKTLITW